MLSKHELDILESGLIYEELHRSDQGALNEDEWLKIMEGKILLFNKKHRTNFKPEMIIENYKVVKTISDFSPLRPKPQKQRVKGRKF